MKVVIFAGGMGTRLAEETEIKPKPMVEIGGHPILWHIMKHYAYFGHSEFFIALGYRGEYIKRYFIDQYTLSGSMTVDLSTGQVEHHQTEREPWRVHLMDTGLGTQTGGRLRRLQPWLSDGTFMVTYGDGVSNIDLGALLDFHRSHGRIATLTAVRPPARFGSVELEDGLVSDFREKPQAGEGWINGGFLVFEPRVFDYLRGDGTVLEADALAHLAEDRQLAAYRHTGFWQGMDTLRDKRFLESLWERGERPWQVWQ